MSEYTKDWDLYIAGKNYNNRIEPNYYDTVDANIAFYNGDQWRNVTAENMPKPVFNIIKRVITFFVASLTTSNVKINFEPLPYADNDESVQGEIEASKIAKAMMDILLEKFKMEYRIKDGLFDAAITGDAAAHIYFDYSKRPYLRSGNLEIQGEIEFELVDGLNVFFGNANNPNVESQPYIIISGRDMVQNLKEEAKRYKEDAEKIDSDLDYGEQAGDSGKIEVDADEYGKALYIIVYRRDKKTGTIKASKSVANAYIYKDIDTGLKHYPIAWMNWEKQKNQYHGRALSTGLLPNQIFINRMFAMVMYHLMMSAFPKAVYNADVIDVWNNEVGAAIPVQGMGLGENIKNIAGYLEPGNMSNQIVQVIELAMQYTKETLGISDAALGQIDPKNTSAIIAVQKSSAIPLENPKSNLYEWIEDIGRICFDMMGTYYGPRPIVLEEDGVKTMQMFDFSVFKDMWLNVSADVGEASYWSEIAAQQTLDNLLQNGYLDIIDYLERVDDDKIPQKQELIQKLEERMQMAQQQANSPEALIAQLPPEEQKAFMNASPQVQQQILASIQQPQM